MRQCCSFTFDSSIKTIHLTIHPSIHAQFSDLVRSPSSRWMIPWTISNEEEEIKTELVPGRTFERQRQTHNQSDDNESITSSITSTISTKKETWISNVLKGWWFVEQLFTSRNLLLIYEQSSWKPLQSESARDNRTGHGGFFYIIETLNTPWTTTTSHLLHNFTNLKTTRTICLLRIAVADVGN